MVLREEGACICWTCRHTSHSSSSSSRMLGRVASSAAKLLAHQLGAGAASSAVQQAAAAAGCSGLLQKLGQACRGFATNSHDIFNIHKHSPHNNWNTEFDFTPDNYKRVSRSWCQGRIILCLCAGWCAPE